VRCRFKINFMTLTVLILAQVSHAEPPPSPAQLNIKPVYEHLLLPDSYVPKEFRIDSPSVATNPYDPPRKYASFQYFLIEVPHPSMGGKISVDSNVDDWIRVTLSIKRVYPLIQDAKSYFAYTTYSSSFTRKVDIGDEALFRPWLEQPWTPNKQMLDKKTHQWDYRSTEGIVRIGRVIFYIGVRGNLEIDRVDADTGKGFESFQGFVTLKDCPTREELDDKMRKVVGGVKSYASSMGWLKDDPEAKIKKSDTGSAPKEANAQSRKNDSSTIPPETVLLAVAAGSIVMTLGAFLQLFGMGGLQSLQDIRGTLEGLFNFSGADITGTEPDIQETQTVQEVEVVPKEPPTLALPDPIPSGFEYQGKVWYRPPWDKGGPYWMDKSDYDAMRSMMRQGKEWSDRWGWVDPAEGKAMEAQNAEAWNKYKSNTDDDIKALTDRIKESQEKLAQIREKQAELERIEQLRERLAELEKQRVLDNSFATYLKDTWSNYEQGVNRDLDALPGELKNMALAAAREVRDTTGALITAARDTANDIYREVTDPDNYKAVAKAAVDTAEELILHPVDSSVKVGNTVKSAGRTVINATSTAATVAVAIASDPVGFAEAALGVDNWRKVLDPNVPVGERVCRALYGVIDTTLNFASGGTKVAVKGVEAGIDGVRVIKAADAATDATKAMKGIEAGLDAAKTADAASDAAKAAKATDTAADTVRITAKIDDPARVQAWEAGRLSGQQKADKLAEALKSGDAGEIKKALVECQKDKHAIGALNKGDDSVKLAYNQKMKQFITDDVDKAVKEKIAQRYGLDPKDVEIVKPTNPTAKPKIGSDLDFTVKVKAKPGEIVPDPNNPGKFVKVEPGDVLYKDVPAKDAQQIYNRELYSKVTSEPIPTDPEKFKAFQAHADKLAHDMDHVAGHRVGAESYGASKQDLEVILQKSGGRFTDPEQAGMVASYKSTHLYQQAENIAKVDPGKAEALIADGMRQTTKQYDNLITTRVSALQSQGIEAAVDQRLTKAVDILKQVENGGIAPAKAEALLRSQLNMSKDDVANMLGGQLAKLHHMKG